MTQMIYRPQTEESFYEGKELIKTPFKNLECDALVVEEDETAAFEKKGWFADPNKMMKPKRTRKKVVKDDNDIKPDQLVSETSERSE